LKKIKIPVEKGEFNFYYNGKQNIMNLSLTIFEDKEFERIVVEELRKLKDRGELIISEEKVYIKKNKTNLSNFFESIKKKIKKANIYLPPTSLTIEDIVSIFLSAYNETKYTNRKGIREYRYVIRNQRIIDLLKN
jgi:hypothetical protein